MRMFVGDGVGVLGEGDGDGLGGVGDGEGDARAHGGSRSGLGIWDCTRVCVAVPRLWSVMFMSLSANNFS